MHVAYVHHQLLDEDKLLEKAAALGAKIPHNVHPLVSNAPYM